MSTPAILFGIYIGIGLLLMIVAVAAPGKEKRTKGSEALGGGDGIDAALMIFIALLWPLWLGLLVSKQSKK